jgi:F-type H+-transporting ATPase subunit b
MSVTRDPWRLIVSVMVLAALAAGAAAVRADDPKGHGHAAGTVEPQEHGPAGAGDEGGAASHGAVHGEDDYSQPPLKFQAPLFAFTLLAFLFLLFAGRKLAWDPLIAGLDSRERRINQAYQSAKEARAQVEHLIREYDARIAGTYDEVKGIVAAARQEADKARADIIATAEAEARTLQEQTIADILRAKDQALADLSAAVERHTDAATEHVLGYRLN